MDTVVAYVSCTNVQQMSQTVQGAVSIYSNDCAGARAKRCQRMFTEKCANQFRIHAKILSRQMVKENFNAVRSKIFKFLQCRICNNCKAKNKMPSKIETLIKIDNDSDENQYPSEHTECFSTKKWN